MYNYVNTKKWDLWVTLAWVAAICVILLALYVSLTQGIISLPNRYGVYTAHVNYAVWVYAIGTIVFALLGAVLFSMVNRSYKISCDALITIERVERKLNSAPAGESAPLLARERTERKLNSAPAVESVPLKFSKYVKNDRVDNSDSEADGEKVDYLEYSNFLPKVTHIEQDSPLAKKAFVNWLLLTINGCQVSGAHDIDEFISPGDNELVFVNFKGRLISLNIYTESSNLGIKLSQ